MHKKKIKKNKEIMLIYAHVMDLNYIYIYNFFFPKFRPPGIGASQPRSFSPI